MALDDWYYSAAEIFDLVAVHGLTAAVAMLIPEAISPDYPHLRYAWASVRTRIGEQVDPMTNHLESELLRIKQMPAPRVA